MRKRILFIASSTASGMIPFASTIINSLSEDDRFEVYCICVNRESFSYEGRISKKAHPVYVNYPPTKMRRLAYFFWPSELIRRIKERIQDVHPNYIHLLTQDFILANFVRTRRDKRRFVYTVHDLHPHELNQTHKENIIRRLITCYDRVCYTNIPRLTTSSHQQLAELKDLFPNKSCHFTTFPALVNEQIINGTSSVEEVDGAYDYILFFGSVDEYKGVDLLVDAYLTSDELQKYKLVIAGKGLDNNYTHANIIRINRFVKDEELTDLFSKAKLVVYPYKSATMSGVLSLAMYFKKPILASDIPFFKEYSSESVTFFASGNHEDLKEKLEQLMRCHAIHVAPDDYEQMYSLEKLRNSYAELYK